MAHIVYYCWEDHLMVPPYHHNNSFHTSDIYMAHKQTKNHPNSSREHWTGTTEIKQKKLIMCAGSPGQCPFLGLFLSVFSFLDYLSSKILRAISSILVSLPNSLSFPRGDIAWVFQGGPEWKDLTLIASSLLASVKGKISCDVQVPIFSLEPTATPIRMR